MATNDFLTFGAAAGANVMTQADYADLAARLNGFSSGTAKSAQLNKAWRQSSIISAMVAQFIADQSGQNAVDDGTINTLKANLLLAIRATVRQATILNDTGAVNAYAATNNPALTALPATGYSQRVSIATANTAASTYAPDGLTAKPIYGPSLQPLQGGEIPVGVIQLMYLVQAGVNGGNGAWILLDAPGGNVDASQADAEAGTDNKKRMSPLRVFQAIAKAVGQATEALAGVAKISTQAQVNNGADDTTIVTPKKLQAWVAAGAAQATEALYGVLKIASSAQASAGTDDLTAMTPAKTATAILAKLNGQTLQSVIGSRSLGTNYNNTTGRPIKVMAAIQGGTGAETCTVVVGGLTVYTGDPGYGTTVMLSFEVPNNVTYSIDVNPKSGTNLAAWAETR